MIGNPYNQALTSFDDLIVTTTVGKCSIGNGGCTLDEATLPTTGGANVLGNVLFSYDTTLEEPAYVHSHPAAYSGPGKATGRLDYLLLSTTILFCAFPICV